MYIIDSGHVRVYKTVGTGPQARDVELCQLGPNAMFGEMAMIDEHRRSASVQATEPTVCTVITKKIFEDQLLRIPPWMVNMIRILVSRLRETNNKVCEIVEQYTAAPQDSGSMLTVDASEAQKVMDDARRESSAAVAAAAKKDSDNAEVPAAREKSAGREKDDGKRKDKARHMRSDQILDSVFDDDDKS
jgi:CRP-like cAMP-binding protein